MNYERIALWLIIFCLVVKVFIVDRRSYYTASNPIGLMDLAEFKNIPDDLKTIWQTNFVNKLMPVIGTKLAAVWADYGSAKQTALSADTSKNIDVLINNLNTAPIKAT